MCPMAVQLLEHVMCVIMDYCLSMQVDKGRSDKVSMTRDECSRKYETRSGQVRSGQVRSGILCRS